MYFVHGNKTTTEYFIEKCQLDGSNCTKLVNSTQPIDSLAMDYTKNRLYFVYSKIGGIAFFDLVTNKVNLF